MYVMEHMRASTGITAPQHRQHRGQVFPVALCLRQLMIRLTYEQQQGHSSRVRSFLLPYASDD